ncbi:MAG: (2R)-ethylmalonyl-CoA mutase [Myxococcota bacterium]|jgi:(2R)-ethylmalonyl-CoA mutase
MRLDERPPWIIRTYAGFADPETTNQRYRANLAKGQRGLSVAFDLPTQNGYDSDHVMSAGEVGGTGVAVCTLADMERLFDGIALDKINTSMTINATAPWLFAMYLALAEKTGAAFDQLRGTVQNDLLKEFVGRGTYVFDPETSLRLSTDVIKYAAEHVPRWNPINSCGYHYMESGATPAQEVGLAIGNAVVILDHIRPSLSVDAFTNVVKRISFFINSGIELVAEICKVRAYSQLWKEICRDEFDVPDVRFRAGCQVRSLTLTAQQPEVNIVRIAYEALPVVMSASARVGALQLPGFREALSLPDEAEQTLALRTQQVLMYETDLADHEDIFEGSIVIEAKTEGLKTEARGIIAKLRDIGYAKAIPWIAEELTAALVTWKVGIESGEQIQVGVNAFQGQIGLVGAPPADETRADAGALRQHLINLRNHRALERDNEAVAIAMFDLRAAFDQGENIMPSSMALARAGGTTGEWTQVIEEAAGGRYAAPLGTEGARGLPLDVPSVGDRRLRIILGKSGLDGHVNAVKLLAVACSRAGMEVVYTGIKQPPEAIVATAVQEDADVIGISSLSGSHLHIASETLRLLKEQGATEIPLLMGGIIPDEDRDTLLRMGVAAVIRPGELDMPEIIARIIELAR